MSKKNQPYTSQLRGVAALLGETPSPAVTQSVPITAIALPQQQPRRYFDPEKLKQLVASVKQHGILEPLLVRSLPSGKYELVAGERRYRAAKEVGLNEVPIVVRELNDQEALQMSLVENLLREDLNPVEETEGILQLLAIHLDKGIEEITKLLYRLNNEIKGNVNHNVMVNSEVEEIQAIFDSLGMMSWQSFVANRLPVLNLPEEILEAIRLGRIEYTKAQAIARIKDSSVRTEMLAAAIAENLSLTQIRERIKAVPTPSPDESLSLKHRLKEVSARLQKAKFWKQPNSEKQQLLEKLISDMEFLLVEE